MRQMLSVLLSVLEGGVTMEAVTLDLGVFFDDDLGPAPDFFFATGVLGAVL